MSPSEFTNTVDTRYTERGGSGRPLAFIGPAALISVGYMDPGNWATDVEGGARFGYQLLWVLLASNLVALLLQSLSARLGIVAELDLAQACRVMYGVRSRLVLWLLGEIAIIACDLAEVLGSAIAINLLFGIPTIWAAVITAFDVFIVLLLQRYGVRKLEAFILSLVLVIGACFLYELFLVRPPLGEIASGFIPHLNEASLAIAVGIIGATVMPHNLYLHSAMVRTRRVASTPHAKNEAIKYNFIDTALALNGAFLINAAILILSAGAFFARGIEVTDLRDAHRLLAPLLGNDMASILFAVALLCAGQSATVTGTLAGQVVMEGFLALRITPWLRRLLTRSLAIIPAVGVLALVGDSGLLGLLIASQIVLSMQLPFAIIPLIRVTGDSRFMGQFVTRKLLHKAAWASAAVITALNFWLIVRIASDWPTLGLVAAIASLCACALFLVHISAVPLQPKEAES